MIGVMPGPIVKQAGPRPLGGTLQSGPRPTVSKKSVAPAGGSVIQKIASFFLGARPASRPSVQGRDRFNRLAGSEVAAPLRLSSLVNGGASNLRPQATNLRPDDQLLTHFLSNVIRNNA